MSTVISHDGTRIVYDLLGEGTPLVLVDGAIAHRALTSFGELAQLLSSDFRVAWYDRRGRGESTDTAPYASEREIEDLEAIINDLGGRACVYGVSAGAVLALEAVRRLQERVTKLAVYEPPFIVDASRPPASEDYAPRLWELLAQGRREDVILSFMTETLGLPAEDAKSMKQSPGWQVLLSIAHTLPYDGTLLADTMHGNPEPLMKFAKITTPTLVLAGGESAEWMQHAAKTLNGIIPDSRFETLPHQTHAVSSAVLAPVLCSFFLS
jgi:pimeloyl-ACP methyl ester carboxylesterase